MTVYVVFANTIYDDIVKELTSLESLQLVTDLLLLPNLVFAKYQIL